MYESRIETSVKEFANYLMDLGFLNFSLYTDFNKKFKEINENEIISSGIDKYDLNTELIFLKDNITKTMVQFYNSLSDERKQLLAFNVYEKYKKKKEEGDNNNPNNFKISDIVEDPENISIINENNNQNVKYIIVHIESLIF